MSMESIVRCNFTRINTCLNDGEIWGREFILYVVGFENFNDARLTGICPFIGSLVGQTLIHGGMSMGNCSLAC